MAVPAGLKSTYAYAAVFSKVQGKFSGIAKFDLGAKNGAAVLGQIEHGSERFGGEAVFVKGSGAGKRSTSEVACLLWLRASSLESAYARIPLMLVNMPGVEVDFGSTRSRSNQMIHAFVSEAPACYALEVSCSRARCDTASATPHLA